MENGKQLRIQNYTICNLDSMSFISAKIITKVNKKKCYLALSTDGLGLGFGIGTTIAGVAPVGDASVVIVIAGAPGLVDNVLTGRSSTRSGVCFCLIVTRCSQKSRLERNPPRTALPLSSCPTAPSSTWTGFCCDVRRSQRLRFFAKIPPFEGVFAPRLDVDVLRVTLSSSSPICSRDAQLDCLRKTRLVVSSFGGWGCDGGGLCFDFESSDFIVLGVGRGWGWGVAESPPEETRRNVGLGAADGGVVSDNFWRRSTEPDSEDGDDFCFSRCSAMASTSAMVESSWVLSSWKDMIIKISLFLTLDFISAGNLVFSSERELKGLYLVRTSWCDAILWSSRGWNLMQPLLHRRADWHSASGSKDLKI